MLMNDERRTISLDKLPRKPKKITGTRFAPILGLSPWSTDFEVWCDMTHTYAIPFEGNKYTLAGQAIEEKVISYLDSTYFFGRGLLKSAEAWYGKTKEQMRYDHFPQDLIFGGMWDARTQDAVFELKTTKRAEDWMRGGVFTPPEYYKLQGALYAHLLGLDTFYLVVTFLEEPDYDNLDAFQPTAKNTAFKKYSLAAEYPNFADKLEDCLRWHERHVAGLQSPAWDERRKNDKEILAALRTSHVSAQNAPDGDIVAALICRIEPLQERVDEQSAKAKQDEDALDALKKQLKTELERRMRDGDKKIDVAGAQYLFELARTSRTAVDTDRLKRDGLYEQYAVMQEQTRLTAKRRNA